MFKYIEKLTVATAFLYHTVRFHNHVEPFATFHDRKTLIKTKNIKIKR